MRMHCGGAAFQRRTCADLCDARGRYKRPAPSDAKVFVIKSLLSLVDELLLGGAMAYKYPSGVAADGAGNFYIADSGNHTIRKLVTATGVVTTLAGTTSRAHLN